MKYQHNIKFSINNKVDFKINSKIKIQITITISIKIQISKYRSKSTHTSNSKSQSKLISQSQFNYTNKTKSHIIIKLTLRTKKARPTQKQNSNGKYHGHVSIGNWYFMSSSTQDSSFGSASLNIIKNNTDNFEIEVIQSANGSTNKEANGTTFKASTFNNMTVLGDFASNPQLTPSDYRIKTNVETLNEIHTVDNLRPVKYKQTQTGENDIGFLAHELQEHYPELVEGEKDGDKMQSVNYNGLLPILINEVQQLKKQIAETRARIHNETP